MPQPLNNFDLIRFKRSSNTLKRRFKIAPFLGSPKTFNTIFTWGGENWNDLPENIKEYYYNGVSVRDGTLEGGPPKLNIEFEGEKYSFSFRTLGKVIGERTIYVNSLKNKFNTPILLGGNGEITEFTFENLEDNNINFRNIVFKENDTALLSSYNGKISDYDFGFLPLSFNNFAHLTEINLGEENPWTTTMFGTTSSYFLNFIGETITFTNSSESFNYIISPHTTFVTNFAKNSEPTVGNQISSQNTIVNLPPNRSPAFGFNVTQKMKIVDIKVGAIEKNRNGQHPFGNPSSNTFLISTEYLNTVPCNDNFSRSWLENIPLTAQNNKNTRNLDGTFSVSPSSWWKQSNLDWDFTGVNVDDDGGATQHLTLITPQIGIGAAHYMKSVGSVFKFRDFDGNIRSSTIARRQKINLYIPHDLPQGILEAEGYHMTSGKNFNNLQFSTTDLELVLLSTPIVSDGIDIETYPIIDGLEQKAHFKEFFKLNNRRPHVINYRENLFKRKGGGCGIGIIREYGNHSLRSLSWLDDGSDTSFPNYLMNSGYATGGDSGGPVFLVDKNNNLVLVSHFSTLFADGPNYAYYPYNKELKRQIDAMNEWGAENLDNYVATYPTFVGLSAF